MSLSFVPQLSSINLVYSSHCLPSAILLLSPLLSPLSLFAPPFILYSWHCVLFTPFHPHFPYTSTTPTPPPLSSSITLAFPGCLSSPPFILPSCEHTSSPPFLPDSFSSSQTNGGKYGNVSVTRQGIREDCVNMAGLSQSHQHNVCERVSVHRVSVKDIMIGDST